MYLRWHSQRPSLLQIYFDIKSCASRSQEAPAVLRLQQREGPGAVQRPQDADAPTLLCPGRHTKVRMYKNTH